MLRKSQKSQKMCYFQPEFHLSKHYDNKFIRPDLESPWSVDFKTTITFKFTTHLSWVLACQRYFTIPSRCAEMAKNRQKMPDFTWNSTNLKVPKVQKKIYPHFLHTKRHSKNTSHLTKSNFCFFQHTLLSKWQLTSRAGTEKLLALKRKSRFGTWWWEHG